jgi:hypothetical protein
MVSPVNAMCGYATFDLGTGLETSGLLTVGAGSS